MSRAFLTLAFCLFGTFAASIAGRCEDYGLPQYRPPRGRTSFIDISTMTSSFGAKRDPAFIAAGAEAYLHRRCESERAR